MSVDRAASVPVKRGYKTISYQQNGKNETFKIFQAEGTQSLWIIPQSQCGCDSIVIPYLTVDWADRIRKDMKENAYKYR